MTFGAPGYLAFLVAAGAAQIALGLWAGWRARARTRFGASGRASILPYVAPVLLTSAVAVAAFAAARPQIGHDEVRVEERGIDLAIVLDVSQSMLADDVAPSRLAVAQEEIRALLERMAGDRAGLVVFAGRPFPRSPLTSDLPALSQIVGGVDRERALVPAGSDLGAAIARASALLAAGEAGTDVMLIVSDGEDHGNTITTAIEAARAAGITVYTAGAGTEAGAAVVDLDPESGELRPRIGPGGEAVVTRLDPQQLRAIADAGGGRYLPPAGSGALAGLASEFDGLESTTFGAEESAEPVERFQWFAAGALALVVAATLVSVRAPAARSAMRRLWPLAASGLFVAALCSTDAADLNRRGNDRYDSGNYAGAIEAYRTAQAMRPESGELHHNTGNALNRDGAFASAIDETRLGLPGADEKLTALLEYALGGHRAGAGQLTEALEAYRRALLADPDDIDAKHNLEIITRLLTPTAAPSPSPTPTAPGPDGTQPPPQPGDPGDTGGDPQTPSSGDDGTPQSGGTPQPGDPEELSPEELQQLLERALEGIDEEFTVEEALRVLELLEERNREELAQPGGPGGGELPDY